MRTVYGSGVFNRKWKGNESVGRGMFPEIPTDLIEKHENIKRQFERIRDKSRRLQGKPQEKWEKESVVRVAHQCGAELAALTRYFDPCFMKDMCMLVFAISFKELETLKVPSLETEIANFKKSSTIQNITNKVSENLIDRGFFCEPVAHGTYFSLDCLEFNQVRLAERAFGGEIGKNNLLLLEEFGPRFRVGMVIIDNDETLKIPKPKAESLCLGYHGRCNACVKACPSNALAEDNVLTCARYFLTNYHCSKCAQVCPVGYESA